MVQIILDEDRGAYEAFIAKLTDAIVFSQRVRTNSTQIG